MKFVVSQFAILAMAKISFGQICNICPNGITSPEQVGSDCEELQTKYQNETAGSCSGLKAGFASHCCPDQKEIIFADNACGWCPNGIDSSDTPVANPLNPEETITCYEIFLVQKSTLTCYYDWYNRSAMNPFSCTFYEATQSTCCPGNEGDGTGGVRCTFCGDGGPELPDLAPFDGQNNCTALEKGALFIPSGTLCDQYKSQFEPFCCPNFAGGGSAAGDSGDGGGGDSGGVGGGGDSGGGDSGGGDEGDYSGACRTTNVGFVMATGLILFRFPVF
eukprot:scaffold3273_cov148-Cylindrotheca_fusiformis.AAC.12